MGARIVTHTWTEPQRGVSSEVWLLDRPEWDEVEGAVEWVAAQMGDEVGNTIVDTDINPTEAIGGDRSDVRECMQALADSVRYSTGEELYPVDCPIFAKYEIVRS